MGKNKVDIVGLNTSKLNKLSNEEMTKLFNELKNGNKLAKDKLVEGNLKLVLSILKKYNNKVDNLDDLFQIGCIGLIKAIDNFDLSYNVMFSTYAVLMIEGEIKRYIRDNSSVRISRSIKQSAYEILSYKEKYFNEYGIYPSNEEICNGLNISSYELYNSLNSLNDVVSIFEPIYNEGGDTIYLVDQIENKESISVDDKLSLVVAIEKLKDKEKEILLRRYINGEAQADIANSLNISQAQVSRLENGAIKTLRKYIS